MDISCRVYEHYVAINKDDGELYEIYLHLVGFEGQSTHTQAVYDFMQIPRKLSIKEFLKLADSVYSGISILYEGMNKNNLMLYQNMMCNWFLYHKKEDWKPLDISKRILTCIYQASYSDISEAWKNSEIYPLVALSELLIEKGFVFQEANVGGGIDEITHTGSVAYSAEYLQFEEFRNNCIKDIYSAGKRIEEKYQGWASIDYRYISVDLTKGSIKVHAIANCFIEVIWTNAEIAPKSFVKEINEKMMCLLGENIKLHEYYKIKA